MKKMRIFKHSLIASLLTMSVSAFAQDKIIPFSESPNSNKTYVLKHFPDNKVIQAEVDYEGLTKEYDIILSDNIKLEFNRKNKIKSIDAKSKLPNSVIPKSIWDYVKSNYPENFIVEWDLDYKHQSVKLNNGVELEFTLKGVFLRIDD
jgi:hypothetical protein